MICVLWSLSIILQPTSCESRINKRHRWHGGMVAPRRSWPRNLRLQVGMVRPSSDHPFKLVSHLRLDGLSHISPPKGLQSFRPTRSMVCRGPLRWRRCASGGTSRTLFQSVTAFVSMASSGKITYRSLSGPRLLTTCPRCISIYTVRRHCISVQKRGASVLAWFGFASPLSMCNAIAQRHHDLVQLQMATC
ncbi:hypothetical protein F4778DRAFT_259287 [Xylariomycetidae sp. FL2044]|nr:hypothetical protein F4778DRAFT_259287 [Xylariomycetidae sp. FL2044]